MGKVLPLGGNYAVAYAVKACKPEVITAYPISPQTTIVERLSEFVANGELDAEFLHVESEHSALSVAIGAAAAGARSYSATCSQGLALMNELLYIMAYVRLPMALTIVARALSAPINIWNDHSDFMSVNDSGWIMMMSSSNQEAYDEILLAYRIAEDPRVLLPVITAMDGYIQSHVVEPVEIVDDEEALSFAPKRRSWVTLNPDKPVTMGPVGDPNWYFEFKRQLWEAMKGSRAVFDEAVAEFAKKFGRSYSAIETYRLDDAEVAIVGMGSFMGTIKAYVDRARKDGIKVGALRVKLFRPFPAEDVAKALSNVKLVGVMDRALVPGSPTGGFLHSDVACSIKQAGLDVRTLGYIAGLGGRLLTMDNVRQMVDVLLKYKDSKEVPKEPIFIGVRE
ncbi:MAG: pyruvate ferredoxin oxidoreductase [Sulfolobales archaeon]|nr:pyruvate ferredoxin oxidoreductase [Sulfolobales archaeon]MCX8185652.1 pyruvate ferredoxin oxidoreductase [Sulfolobales archaeon]MDW7969595.1 pyruvate ferredoxin oxidoreductase [Sulfolobales archaeon]